MWVLYRIAILAAALEVARATSMGVLGRQGRAGPLYWHCLNADQRKGNQEAATSIKHVCIDQLFTHEVKI
jgi:hypothetical protein